MFAGSQRAGDSHTLGHASGGGPRKEKAGTACKITQLRGEVNFSILEDKRGGTYG